MKQAAVQHQDGNLTKETLKSGWARVAQRLKGELGDDLFNSWFARMEAEDFARSQLTVSVPTRFLKSWIENHYATKLRKVAETEFRDLKAITVRVRQQGETLRTASTDGARPVQPERNNAAVQQ